MANTQVSPKQIKQDGASSNQVLAWNGSTWAPTTNGTGSVSSVDTVQPAAGLTITGGPITSTGTLTFALANDLAGLEGLSTTGLAVRTGDGVWATRSIVSSSVADSFAGIGVGNGDGSGNPTINVNTDNSTIKLSVEAATTANIALTGAQTIDGLALSAGQRCLVKNQSAGLENGIWTVASGSWTRSTDYNTNAKAEHGLIVFVQGGTVNGNKFFKVDQSKPTIGTTPLTFTEVFGATGDGNGIYSGSGTIATAAVATVGSGSTFTIDYNGAADAILVSDSGSSTTIKSKNGTNAAIVDNASVSLTAGSNSAVLTSTGYDVVTSIGGPQLSLNSSDALIFKGSQQLLVRAGDSSLGTGTYYFQADSTNSKLYLKASTSELDINATRSLAKAPYHALQGHNSTTQAELRLYEQSSAGTNYTAFKTQNQTGDVTYILPAASTDGLMINSSSTLSWGTATNAHLGSSVGGIYKGSGTIATGAVATLGAAQSFTIDYAGGGDALRINDSNESLYISNKDQDNYLELADTTVTLSVGGTYQLYLQSNYGLLGETNNRLILDQENLFSSLKGGGSGTSSSTITVGNSNTVLTTPYFQISGNTTTTPGEIRIHEQSSAGNNYTAIKAQDQTASITYTLPAAAPAVSGYVLSATTAGVMSWVAASGGSDGNGIYTGSGTIGTNAVATLASGSNFTVDYNGGSDAMVFSDSLGSVILRDKTGSSFMGTDSNGSGLYSGSDAFTLSESTGGASLNTDLSISDGKLLLTSISTPTTFSANQNNFALSSTAAVLRLSSDASRNLTGIANSGTFQEGRVLTVINVGANDIVLTSEDTNSTDVNRFALGASSVTLKAAEAITLWYDTTSTRWRPIVNKATGAGGSGDITNGGNTTGAAITIGTNDAFGLNLETNNVTRMAITGGASTGGAVTMTNVNANTNTVQDVLTISANSSGTSLANYGTGVLFQGKSATVDNRDMARISSYWTQPTDASRESGLSFQLGDNAGALAEVMKLDRTSATGVLTIGTTTPVAIGVSGIAPATSFTFGGSSSAVTLGGSSGGVTISNNSTSNILIHNTVNAATSTTGIVIGSATAFSQTSGTRNYINVNSGFAPTSGTAIHNQFSFTGTFNQTGGANGIARSININPVITAVADYRAVEIAANGTNVKGIYQTGATATNNFVGKTAFGSTTTPTETVNVTGNMLVAGQYASTRFALTDGATIALDWNNSNVQSVTLGGNRTFTFANPKDGGRYLIRLKQDATGSRTVTWPTIIWRGGTAPTLTTTANKVDLITLIYDGTSYYGDASLNY